MEHIDWKIKEQKFHGEELIWLGVRKDGRWVASLGGKLPYPEARYLAGPGQHMVLGDYESKDAAVEAAKKYIDQRHPA